MPQEYVSKYTTCNYFSALNNGELRKTQILAKRL